MISNDAKILIEELKPHAGEIVRKATKKENAGSYPHDCISRVSLKTECAGHQIDVVYEYYSDRDGKEDDPITVKALIDGADYKNTGLDYWLSNILQP